MYKPTIGLEIHIELKTKSKMFCDCPNDPDEKEANFNICPICLGHPGTLPVINQEAVKKVIKTGLALNCQIPEFSKFDRKNYFYPDLPKGYQISQYDSPLCLGGYLEIPRFKENSQVKNFQFSISNFQTNSNPPILKLKRVRIRRIHLEEDTARLLHMTNDDDSDNNKKDYSHYRQSSHSLVDFNRAGIPLMELVTEPDINSAKEARDFAQELQLILRYLKVSDANMEKGQLRVEVNISLQYQNPESRIQDSKLGTKVEIKNLNSFRSVERAIEYEIQRQTELLSAGKKIVQETRGWLPEPTASSRRVAGTRLDDVKGVTVSQREKEEAHDYRYFSEPDLPPLSFSKDFIRKIKSEIPELPQQRRKRLIREYNLDEKITEIFVQYKDLGEYFEKTISELPPNLKPEELSRLIKLTANYLTTDLLGLLKEASISDEDFLISPQNFADFIILIYQDKISGPAAKVVLKEMFAGGTDPSHIIEEKGLSQLSDEKEIEKIVKGVVLTNQAAVNDYKKGKENAFQFLVGQVMVKTRGKANPQIVGKILNSILTKNK